MCSLFNKKNESNIQKAEQNDLVTVRNPLCLFEKQRLNRLRLHR